MKVLITSMDNEFDRHLADIFTRNNYKVLEMGAKTDTLDCLIDTTDFRHKADLENINPCAIEETFRQNVLKPMATLETYISALDKGEGKRLVYITSCSASINETHDVKGYGYNMSKAALHQFIQLTRNKLPAYTFRLFDPLADKLDPKLAAEAAFLYITRRRGTENHDPMRDDEENIVIRDAMGRMHGW